MSDTRTLYHIHLYKDGELKGRSHAYSQLEAEAIAQKWLSQADGRTAVIEERGSTTEEALENRFQIGIPPDEYRVQGGDG